MSTETTIRQQDERNETEPEAHPDFRDLMLNAFDDRDLFWDAINNYQYPQSVMYSDKGIIDPFDVAASRSEYEAQQDQDLARMMLDFLEGCDAGKDGEEIQNKAAQDFGSILLGRIAPYVKSVMEKKL